MEALAADPDLEAGEFPDVRKARKESGKGAAGGEEGKGCAGFSVVQGKRLGGVGAEKGEGQEGSSGEQRRQVVYAGGIFYFLSARYGGSMAGRQSA